MTKVEILKLKGRDLDVAVAERIMGWRWLNLPDIRRPCFKPPGEIAQFLPKFVERNTVTCSDSPPDRLPHYSTDIAAAWQVVEAMRPEHGFWIDGDDGYAVEFQHGMPRMADYRHGRASAPTAPEAICKAALLAKLESGEV